MKNLLSSRATRITAFFVTTLLINVGSVNAQQQGLAERLRALNNNLLQLHGRAQDAPANSLAEIHSQAATVMQDRSTALQALIRQSPKDALALAFSQPTVDQLAATFPQSASLLETQGNWQ